jgi:ParB family chromosome partitioning protein
MSTTGKPRRLGRGLSSLLGDPVRVPAPGPQARVSDEQGLSPSSVDETHLVVEGGGVERPAEPARRLVQAPIDSIIPSRFQPRHTFDEASLRALADSIRASGVMQPIALRLLTPGTDAPAGARFELVAGERRWRAARLAGLEAVPAVLTPLSDRESAEWALVENLQRSDLNPMERAFAFRNLADRFSLGQAEIAERVGLDRSSVANFIRLTELEDEIRTDIASGRLTAGHGKALLAVPSGPRRVALAQRAAREGWSVRRLEASATSLAGGPVRVERRGETAPEEWPQARREAARRDLERRIEERLGARVRISTDASGLRGRIVVSFADLEHLGSILSKFGLSNDEP